MASVIPRPPARRQTSVVQIFDIPVVVSAETVFDVARLAACCAPVPGLGPVVESLEMIYRSVERVSWNRARCRKLSTKAMQFVFVICDHYDNARGDSQKLQVTVEKTVKNNPSGSNERKKAEEQLYRLRVTPRSEIADLAPPELACECIRLGKQAEYSGTENEIWKGRWLDKQDVALIFAKEYKRGNRDENAIRRFDRQIKVWRKLDNPHVLRLYGWCKFDEETYLVSPWLRNRDVVRYLDGDRARSKKCLDLINGIAQGLRYLHNQDIIHGSLKPSNILVQDDGRAVLSDFSLAKFATPDARNTKTNPQVNVFRYQAPEVILDQPISRASDVYSWAMTALEIITGHAPYHTQKAPGSLIGHVIVDKTVPNREDYPSPVFDKNPQIWELFEKCWDRDPSQRPTAKDIIDVISSIPDPE
ncbi:hypothetical protein FRB90_003529 [Tulasnella sp. 427]|nr:hypothetical protein FRB90_003529 [Tulasnella sp. 427]